MSTPRELLNRALDQTEQLFADLDATHLDRPTGCAEFTVAELAAHLLAVVNRLTVVLTTGTFEGTSVTWDADDAAAEFQRLRSLLTPRLTPADSSQPVTMPWGPSTAGAAIGAYAAEFTVHDWDLAIALTTPETAESLLDTELAVAALAAYRKMLPPGERPAGVPFAAEVKVPDTATAYQKLVAFTGRDPQVATGDSPA